MKNFGLILMLLCLFTGCIGDDHFIDDVIAEQNCAVSFTPALVAAATKTASSSCLAKDTQVRISAYLYPSGGSEAVDYSQSQLFSVSDAVGTLAPVGDALIVTNNFRYNFYAYSPAIDFNAGSKKTIDIKHGDDFMIAQVASEIVGRSSKISLPVLSRKCSLVQFLVRCASSNQVLKTVALGTGGLTLNGLTHSPISYTLGDGDIKLTGVALDGTAAIASNAFAVRVPDVEYLGAVVLLPKLSSGFTFNLNLVLVSRSMDLKATIPAIAFAPGCQYLYTVEITDDVIKVCLVLDWNTSGSGFSSGAPNAKIEVGQWNINNNSTTAGNTNTSVSLSPWITNPLWNTLLGGANGVGSVTGWNPITNGTSAGSTNTTTTTTPWGNAGASHTGGGTNGGGNVSDWNNTTNGTNAGSTNTTATTTPWGNAGASHAGGGTNGSGNVSDWNNTTNGTSAGATNTTVTTTPWGNAGASHAGGGANGSGNVSNWNNTTNSTSAGATNTTVTTTPWGNAGASHTGGGANGSNSVAGWNAVNNSTTGGI